MRCGCDDGWLWTDKTTVRPCPACRPEGDKAMRAGKWRPRVFTSAKPGEVTDASEASAWIEKLRGQLGSRAVADDS